MSDLSAEVDEDGSDIRGDTILTMTRR